MQNGAAVNRPFVRAVWCCYVYFALNLFFSAIFQHENLPMVEYGVKERNQGIKEFHARFMPPRALGWHLQVDPGEQGRLARCR